LGLGEGGNKILGGRDREVPEAYGVGDEKGVTET